MPRCPSKSGMTGRCASFRTPGGCRASARQWGCRTCCPFGPLLADGNLAARCTGLSMVTWRASRGSSSTTLLGGGEGGVEQLPPLYQPLGSSWTIGPGGPLLACGGGVGRKMPGTNSQLAGLYPPLCGGRWGGDLDQCSLKADPPPWGGEKFQPSREPYSSPFPH